MLRIGICDDEKINHETIKTYLKKDNQTLVIDCFEDGKSLLKAYEIKKYDLVFMDVEIPGETGIEIAKKIRGLDEKVEFIFISAYPKYALETYEFRTFWFLEKPVTMEQFSHVFKRVLEKIEIGKTKIVLKRGSGVVTLNMEEILYVRSKFKYLEVHTKNEVYEEMTETLKNIENRLRSFCFVRINNNLIVNMKEIIDFGTKEVGISNGEKLEMSVRKRKEALNVYMNYLAKVGV